MITLFFNGVIVLAFLSLCLGFAELARIVVHRVAIDMLEISQRWHQLQLDNERQRAKLSWQEFSALQIIDNRQKMRLTEDEKC